MINPIKIFDDEKAKEYTLEFDLSVVKYAENRGFSIGDVERFPATKIPELFWYAFRKHHPEMAKANTDKLLEDLGGIGGLSEEFMERLGGLYQQAVLSVGDEKVRKNSLRVEL